MSPRWTPEEKRRLADLWPTDLSLKQIGAQLGGRSGDTVYRQGKTLGLGPKPFTAERSPTWIAILRICADGIPRTVHELAKATGAARHTVDCLFWERKRAKQAHVVRWQTGHGAPVPYWLPTPGNSARRPRTLTPAQVSKRFRDRLRENDPIAYRAYLARTTTRAALKAGRVKPQHAIVRALFGMGGTTS